jgi:prevent-host-death family protein
MQTWQIQDAKARMSELVKFSQVEPQSITHHGKSVAVVVSRDTFERLSHNNESLVSFMKKSPFYGDDIEFGRDQSLTRDVEF